MKFLLLCCLLLPSCGVYRTINESVERLDLASQEADKALEGVQAALVTMGDRGRELADTVTKAREAIAKADINQDGRITGFAEWQSLLLELLALLGVGAYAKTVNDKRRANAQTFYAEIAALKERSPGVAA